MQLNLLIVEDCISYGVEVERIAHEIGYNVIGNVDNSADALEIIFCDHPDIILMDINIKGRMTGIDVAEKVKHLNIPILYITSFNDSETYAKAEASSFVGYIVKPVDKLTLSTSLKLLMRQAVQGKIKQNLPQIGIKAEAEYLYFNKSNVYHKVLVSDILFVKSENNYCSFTLIDNSNYLLRIKLSEVEELLLSRKFIRCHRQYIVNKMKISKVDTSSYTLLVAGTLVPFSRSKKQEILSIGVFLS